MIDKKRVLVIDDHDLVLDTSARSLRRAGFDVDTAEDGDVGLRLFRANPPDIVITDLIMPNKEGIETIRELRKIAPEMPIIAISGGMKVGGDFLRMAELMGATYTFPKPLDYPDLITKIRELLKMPAE